MSRVSFHRFMTAAIVTALLTVACKFPFQIFSNSESAASEVENQTSTTTEPIGSADDEAVQPSGDGAMSGFRCPESPQAYALWFDHNVKFDTPGFGSWDVLTNGTIVLSVAEGLSEGTVHMPFQPGEVIVPGTVTADFGRGEQTCSFEGAMEVIVNIDGNCDQGIVHLNIVENWGEVDTTMTCCSDGQDCDTFPFQWMLPVVQYSDVQFTAANGYQVTKPFAGGSGQLTWTMMPPVQPVPLTE